MAKKLTPTQALEKELNDIEIKIFHNDHLAKPDKKQAEELNKKRLALIKKLGRKTQTVMTEIIFKRLSNGQILCEMEGDKGEIAKMICEAMIKNIDIASIITATIPSFLDEKKIDRAGFCKQIMNAQGNRPL